MRWGTSRLARLRRAATPYLLLLPAAALVIALVVVPVFDAVRLGFTDWDWFAAPQWVGLDNFEAQLSDGRFKEALTHNLLILLALPVWILLPYCVSWALYRGVPGWRFFRLAFFIPVVLSPAIVGIYYGVVLEPNGPFNELLRAVGLGALARAWLNDPGWALPMLIAILIWSTFGIGVLIFLAGLANLDNEQIDAARVDGANGFQVQRHVVFWQMLPVVEFWAILTMIISFTSVFPLVYSLTRGGPGTATYTVDFNLYQEAFANGNLGYASSIGTTMLALMAIIGMLQLLLLRRGRA